MSQEKIINRVNELLVSSDLQQKQLAEHLHIKPQTFNGYMTGHRPFNLEVVIAIADYFKVSVDYVLGRSDER
ncbi:helix-turn-helix domain-containing protein [Paenibacillus sp. TC-CSREp1]|uniref:helix-turn-helix domain-containing protein n=1 Tax=Paenibacillus sp. TC-CSREp1 TaxID=3410089 RepID=UPI003CEC473A